MLWSIFMYRPQTEAPPPKFSWKKGSRSKARYFQIFNFRHCPQLQSCAIHAEHALLQVFPHNRSLWLHWHLAVVISWLWLDPCKVPQLDLASLIWTLPWTALCYMVAWSAFFRPCRTLVSLQSFCWTSWSVFLVWMELGSSGECLTQVSEGVSEPHTTAARTWHSSPSLWHVCCCNPWDWVLAFNP